ncbi:hypothetical protein EMWEY_00010650 [Eimeria maxima]|uniref:Elongation factor Ts, mitochondrial n=1 Tax=Eimeria maxima TaxID=5804 RepID=U6MIQ4_EIMMA|nr:hypothetical protein EMWEY_00010650 [Eimeria maxima]CDJ61515.1 hypothetical protein EMWEY_00010650 [Eimeria maxima]
MRVLLKISFLLLFLPVVFLDAFQLYVHRNKPCSFLSSSSGQGSSRSNRTTANRSHPYSAQVRHLAASADGGAAGAAANAGKAAAAEGTLAAVGPAAPAPAAQLDTALIKKLRQLTSAGYGACIRALQHSGGDVPKAVQWLRQQGAADVAAAAAAAADATGTNSNDNVKEGIIGTFRLEAAPAAAATGAVAATAVAGVERVAAVHVTCSSDFVSHSDVFCAAARRAAAAACSSPEFAAAASAAAARGRLPQEQAQLLQQLLALPVLTSESAAGTPAAAADAATTDAEAVKAAATETVGTDLAYTSRLVGEKVQLKGFAVREALRGSGIVSSYSHQPAAADAAALVVLLHLSYKLQQQQEQQQEQQQQEFEKQIRNLGRQICLHIAASRPLAVRVEDLPPDMVAQERQYVLSSMNSSSNSSKNKDMPEALKQKIVEGKMGKWYQETVLLKQPWALDDSKRSTEKVLQEAERLLKAKINIEGFDLLEVKPHS